MSLHYVKAGCGWEHRQENVVVSGGSKRPSELSLAGSQPLYVSALNVNGLTLNAHTARLGKLKTTFNVKGRQ